MEEGCGECQDLVLSGRVAEKRVEEALFTRLRKEELNNGKPLRLRYVATDRNRAILNKLKDLGEELEAGLVQLNSEMDGWNIISIES